MDHHSGKEMIDGTKRKTELMMLTEAEARSEGISRADLIEAVELAFLYNRGWMAEWARKMKRWKMREQWSVRKTAGIGLLRQAMERMGLNQAESLSAVQTAPEFVIEDMLEIIWDDGTGRNRLPECAYTLVCYWRAGAGGDADDSAGTDYQDG